MIRRHETRRRCRHRLEAARLRSLEDEMAENKIRLEYRKIDELIPYEHNAKLHPPEQIAKLVRSFDEFGRIVPAGIDADGHLIFGHGRILAARERGDTDFPCVVIDHLSEDQRRAFVHADNLLAESETDAEILRSEMIALQTAGFDISLTGFDPEGLQLGDEDEAGEAPFWGDVDSEESDEYAAFMEKFKHKLTTDDVYTPQNVYDALLGWARKHYDLGAAQIVRPFYPGGDYQSADYPDGCVVVDNPPFSILSEICAWYEEHGVRYLLFAPGLTLFSINAGRSRYLPIGLDILYTNGAAIATSFVTNLGEWKIECCPDLFEALDGPNDENKRKGVKALPSYKYPSSVCSVAMNTLARYGQLLQIPESDAAFIRALDAQREVGKAIYGGGFLLSEKAAAEKAAAEKAAAEKAAALRSIDGEGPKLWELSEREKKMIAELGGGNG